MYMNKPKFAKKKSTDFDKFKYGEDGVYRYHISKLKNGLQTELENKIKTGQINLFVTLNPNIDDVSFEGLKKMVDRWEYLVEDRVLRGNQRSKVENYYYWGFIEDGSTHETRHMHLLFCVPVDRLEWFERTAYKMWKKVCKSGSANVQQVNRETS